MPLLTFTINTRGQLLTWWSSFYGIFFPLDIPLCYAPQARLKAAKVAKLLFDYRICETNCHIKLHKTKPPLVQLLIKISLIYMKP